MKYVLTFNLNGSRVEALVRPTQTLLDLLRDQLDVTSPKRGCDTGDCGACTVLMNGRPVRSCITLALTAEGKDIVTVEGLGAENGLTPLQKSFAEHGASQCGFCTPGMLLSGTALLEEKRPLERRDIAEGMSGNICRCGCYEEITEAVLAVSNPNNQEQRQ